MIATRLRQTACKKEYRDRVALIAGNERLTYAELYDRAENAAELLKRQGTSPVILYGHKESSMFVSMLACIFAGRTYVPIDRFTPEMRIRKIIAASGASLLLSADGTAFPGIECCSLAELGRYSSRPLPETDSDIVYILFTSGTTGEPKGVPISKTNLDSFLRWLTAFPPLSEYRRITVMNQASLSFDLSVADIFYAFCGGHTLAALDRQTQENYSGIFSFMDENRVNLCVVTPTFMKLCLLNPDFRAENFPALKCVYFCGERLEQKTAEKLHERFPDVVMINAYGPTEAASAVSAVVIDEKILRDVLLPVGTYGNFATDIFITDDEIVLRGDSVFGGYLDGEPGGHYTKDGVNSYRTGDLGFFWDGYLYCRGRKDDQIKYKGFRIELADIERNLAEVDGVRECAVTAKRDGDTVKAIHAFVVPEAGAKPDAVRLKNALKQRLPDYMIPKTIRFLDALPVSANGKTDRKALNEI